MHFPKTIKPLLALALVAVLTACSSGPLTQPTRTAKPATKPQPVVQPQVRLSRPSATVTPLVRASSATSPWDYVALARNAQGDEKHRLMMNAIEGFLDLKQSATARSLLEQYENLPLPEDLYRRKQLLLAQSYYSSGQYNRAEAVLQPLSNRAGLDRGSAADILLLRARSLAAVGNTDAALRMLVAREPLLTEQVRIRENQQILWNILATLDTESIERLRLDAANPTLAQWADLALISQRSGWNPHALRNHLQQWASLHPAHPAASEHIPGMLAQLGNQFMRYRKVALLLPLSSGFSDAAKAVYDGFALMAGADSNPAKPQIAVYDIGEKPELVSFYYDAAVREGAELIVGPLGKVAVETLLTEADLAVPTLLLGSVENPVTSRANVFQFSLSPEDEARETARRAFADGHRVAAVLYPDTEWGKRQLAAFDDQWQTMGGEIAESNRYAENGPDHSQPIKLMVNLDESETRHRRIERIAGTELSFSPRRREDLDMVFMIARSTQGRLLKPQINFHAGKALPVYAISQVYGGSNDPVNDLDLDGVVFGDMPWLLQDAGINRTLRQILPEANAYRDQPLDRLFALGVDAYQLLFRLDQMKSNPLLSFSGATGELRLAADGTILRDLSWARFEQGLPIAIGPASILGLETNSSGG